MPKRSRAVLAIVASIVAVACQTPVPRPQGLESAVPEFPESAYRQAANQGEAVYDLDPAESRLRVLVFAAGPLADLGHTHVVVAGRFRGAVALPRGDVTDARLDLVVPVAALQVDPPAARRALGGDFAEPLDAADRQGTRDHMLGPALLDSDTYPRVAVTLAGVRGALPRPILDLTIHVHGGTTTVAVPAAVTVNGDRLTADGRLILRQTDLGLTPYSAAGGALQVADPLVVEFHVVGSRREQGGEKR